MSIFKNKISLSKAASIGALALFVLLFSTATRSFAADSTIKIYDSTFNEFIDAVEPLEVDGNYNFGITIDLGIFGRHRITLCDSPYTADVTDLTFGTIPIGVTAHGDVNATWCGLNFAESELNAVGDIAYNSPDSTVRFTFSQAAVRLCGDVSFGIFGTHRICLPFSINMASTLSIPPVYVGPSLIRYETADGTRMLFMRPHNMALEKKNGYIEFTSDVSF